MPASARFIHSARLIALLTLCSRIVGLVRECVFSYFFSTSQLLSAFRIAFMVPNLARRLFGEGALSSAVIPVLTASLKSRGEEASRRFVGSLLTALFLGLGAVVVGVEVLIAIWRALDDDPALKLTAILLPYMPLICTVAVAGGVLNVRRHFSAPAAAPILLNLAVVGSALAAAFIAGRTGTELMYAVCAGVLLGGVGQLALTALALRTVGFFPIFGGSLRDPRIRRILSLMAPMVVGLSAVQINSLFDHLIAYFFVTQNGERVGPAVLGYAQYLYQLPLGVFGIAFATAIFPILSQQAVDGDQPGMAKTLERGVRLSLFVALPATVGLMFVAHPLVATLFQRGEFDAVATRRVAGTLAFYSLGLVAYFTNHLLVRAFYAQHDSRTPTRIALCMVGLNLAMNLVLVFPLQERGLALATAICAFVQLVWLSLRISRALPQFAWRAIAGAIARMVVATAIMAGALLMPGLVFERVGLDALPAARLIGSVLLGTVTYGLAAKLLGIHELAQVLHRGRDGGRAAKG